jgi:hypothetical protein
MRYAGEPLDAFWPSGRSQVVQTPAPAPGCGHHRIASKQHHTLEWREPASGDADGGAGATDNLGGVEGAASMDEEVRASVLAALFENVDSDDGRARNDPLWGEPQTAFRERVRVTTFPSRTQAASGSPSSCPALMIIGRSLAVGACYGHRPFTTALTSDAKPMQKTTEPRWLTYAELAELMEASTEAARAFANRLELRKQRGNDGKARVYVEPDVLASRLDRSSSGDRLDSTPGDRKEDSQIRDLRDHVNTLREHLDRQHADHQAEVTRLIDQAERQREEVSRARLEVDRAREDAKREREHTHALFNQVKDLADRLAHAEAGRARAVTELEHVRQSWWKRMLGR